MPLKYELNKQSLYVSKFVQITVSRIGTLHMYRYPTFQLLSTNPCLMTIAVCYNIKSLSTLKQSVGYATVCFNSFGLYKGILTGRRLIRQCDGDDDKPSCV